MTKKIKLALLAKRNECNKRQCVFLTTAAVVLLFFESRPSPMISASDLDIGNVKRACGAVRSSSSSAAVAPRSIAGAGSTTALALQRAKWAAATAEEAAAVLMMMMMGWPLARTGRFNSEAGMW